MQLTIDRKTCGVFTSRASLDCGAFVDGGRRIAVSGTG
jgi:hypothetical protein